jgi:uncharacterized damage-inducible protein DinB
VPNHPLAELIDDLVQAYDGDPWHGPPLRKVLDGVTHEVAAARPVANGHSIWELVAHLAAWDGIVSDRILERRPIEAPDTGDFPQVTDVGPDAWTRALLELDRQHARLVQTVSALDIERLGEIVAGKAYPTAHMIRGVAQHMAYHAGQIALLRKLVSSL